MKEIKILESETITDNSIISIISIGGVRYAFVEARHETYSGAVSIYTNLVKL